MPSEPFELEFADPKSIIRFWFLLIAEKVD